MWILLFFNLAGGVFEYDVYPTAEECVAKVEEVIDGGYVLINGKQHEGRVFSGGVCIPYDERTKS